MIQFQPATFRIRVATDLLQRNRRRPITQTAANFLPEPITTHLRVPFLESCDQINERVRSKLSRGEAQIVGGRYDGSGCQRKFEEASEKDDEECESEHEYDGNGVEGLQEHDWSEMAVSGGVSLSGEREKGEKLVKYVFVKSLVEGKSGIIDHQIEDILYVLD